MYNYVYKDKRIEIFGSTSEVNFKCMAVWVCVSALNVERIIAFLNYYLQSIHLCTSKLLKEIEEGPFKTYYYHHLMHPRARKTFGVSLAGTCRQLACNQTDIFLKM